MGKPAGDVMIDDVLSIEYAYVRTKNLNSPEILTVGNCKSLVHTLLLYPAPPAPGADAEGAKMLHMTVKNVKELVQRLDSKIGKKEERQRYRLGT